MLLLCRFKVLADCASYDSWQKALAYHKEMNGHGMELPPSELIEFVEVSAVAFAPLLYCNVRAADCHCRGLSSQSRPDLICLMRVKLRLVGCVWRSDVTKSLVCNGASLSAGSPADGVHGL